MGVTAGEGLADEAGGKGDDDSRFCGVSGSDLGIAGGCTGRDGGAATAAAEAGGAEAALVVESEKTLRSDQSREEEEAACGGEGEGVRGGGVRVCATSSELTLWVGDDK